LEEIEKSCAENGACHKAGLPAETQKEYEHFVRTPFHTHCPFRLVCYTFVFRVVIGEVFTNAKVKLLCSEVCASHK
jgi:hypothetical protein